MNLSKISLDNNIEGAKKAIQILKLMAKDSYQKEIRFLKAYLVSENSQMQNTIEWDNFIKKIQLFSDNIPDFETYRTLFLEHKEKFFMDLFFGKETDNNIDSVEGRDYGKVAFFRIMSMPEASSLLPKIEITEDVSIVIQDILSPILKILSKGEISRKSSYSRNNLEQIFIDFISSLEITKLQQVFDILGNPEINFEIDEQNRDEAIQQLMPIIPDLIGIVSQSGSQRNEFILRLENGNNRMLFDRAFTPDKPMENKILLPTFGIENYSVISQKTTGSKTAKVIVTKANIDPSKFKSYGQKISQNYQDILDNYTQSLSLKDGERSEISLYQLYYEAYCVGNPILSKLKVDLEDSLVDIDGGKEGPAHEAFQQAKSAEDLQKSFATSIIFENAEIAKNINLGKVVEMGSQVENKLEEAISHKFHNFIKKIILNIPPIIYEENGESFIFPTDSIRKAALSYYNQIFDSEEGDLFNNTWKNIMNEISGKKFINSDTKDEYIDTLFNKQNYKQGPVFDLIKYLIKRNTTKKGQLKMDKNSYSVIAGIIGEAFTDYILKIAHQGEQFYTPIDWNSGGQIRNALGQDGIADEIATVKDEQGNIIEQYGFQIKNYGSVTNNIFTFYEKGEAIKVFTNNITKYVSTEDIKEIRLQILDKNSSSEIENLLETAMYINLPNWMRYTDANPASQYKDLANNFFIINMKLFPSSILFYNMAKKLEEDFSVIGINNADNRVKNFFSIYDADKVLALTPQEREITKNTIVSNKIKNSIPNENLCVSVKFWGYTIDLNDLFTLKGY